MLHNRKPDEWEVFNDPARNPVKYYSILKKKREFSQLIRQFDAQVFKHGYFHYCSIVPKNINASLNNRCELFIIFLGEVPNTSFIGFRVKVSKETFIHESNSLLLFLKKSKKPVFYFMNNNCIHVQCGGNAWELFYLLYDVYLRQYVLTVIGTQFFYHFVYSFCIQREKQLLELLFKGSKIIRISKKSIYYKIHRKRKISISNLIHMTLNMPQSKKCIIPFNSKVSLLHSNVENKTFYTCSGSKIHVSKLVLKKFKKQIIDTMYDNAVTNPVASVNDSAFLYTSEILDSKCGEYKSITTKSQNASSCNSTLKRKLDEIDNDEYDIHCGPTASKFLKISDSVCHKANEDQWEQYTDIEPYTIKTYSDIPCLKYLVPNILSNGKSLHVNNSDSLCNSHNHDYAQSDMVPPLSQGREIGMNNDCLVIEETCDVADQINLPSTAKSICDFESSQSFKENTSDKVTFVCTNNSYNLLKPSSNLKIPNSGKQESHHSQNITCFNNDIKTSSYLSSLVSFNQGKINSSEEMNFKTAAGKTINISNTALLTASRLIEDVCDDEKQKVLQSNSNFARDKKRFKSLPSIDYNEVCGKSETENIYLDKTGIMPSHSIRITKCSELTSENHGNDLFENVCENYKTDNINNANYGIFSTAAGKTLTVSNSAMHAAQKIIQDVLQEESATTSSAVSNFDRYKKKICKNSSAFRDIGLPSKKSVAEEIVNMDKTLVEKLFEDTVFDDDELEPTSGSNTDKNSGVVLESKSAKNLLTHKPRKSLGGRRSMRFSADAH